MPRMRTLTLALLLPATLAAQPRPRLTERDVDAIARLVMLEDRRTLDSAQLAPLLRDAHPEVRRRAAITVARIGGRRGVALLRARPLDADTSVAAATVFAVGQLRDTASAPWLDSLLAARSTPPNVVAEAAAGLGKLKTADARAALLRFLAAAPDGPRLRDAIGDALLAAGRTPRGELAPIVRWTHDADEELRWRATWALFRGRDPAAVPALLTLADDRSALVRSWAVRGLTRTAADSAGLGAEAERRLLAATRDADRRARTEAIRALGTYADSAAVGALVAALAAPDAWVAASAAEGLARAADPRAERALTDATEAGRSCAVRLTALQSLQSLKASGVRAAAERVAADTVPYCRLVATQIAWTARDSSLAPDARRAARRDALASMDAATRAGALRAMSAWADTSDLAWLRDVRERAASDATPYARSAATALAATIERRATRAPRSATPRPERPLAEYRALVERWVVPDYEGRPRPRAVWDSPRGAIEIELYPGDAPLATEAFVHLVESGALAGTDFTRVVPDFVDQQRTIVDGVAPQRDEVNRHRLTRGNLSWATAGLDTGSPGYTLGHTPQPHNEGDFTSLGRVVRGMDVVDRIELGDRITGARMVKR